jgi:hypothetical protein
VLEVLVDVPAEPVADQGIDEHRREQHRQSYRGGGE